MSSEIAEGAAVKNCRVRAIEFDFENKTERIIELTPAVRESLSPGRYLWIDVDMDSIEPARQLFCDLGLVDEIIEDALTGEPATQHGRYASCLHMVVSGCRLVDHNFDLERVDVVVTDKFLVTIHRGPVMFLQSMEREYAVDFAHFAQSPSFLIYELWEHLLENYLAVQKRFEEQVVALQSQLIGDVDDTIFARVSELGADLLHFRKVVLPARAVLTDISTRKSRFINDATQSYLANMVGTIERVLQDLLVDRDILDNSLNLYMSLVGYRTNQIMKKLTVVSVIFLPLTFLCGVYGMNFQFLPELQWHFGYIFFWFLVALIVVVIVIVSRRARLL